MIDQKEVKWLLHLAAPHRWKLLLSCVCAAASSLLTLVPFIIIYLIGMAWMNQTLDVSTIWKLSMYVFASILLRFVFLALSSLLAHVSAYHLLYEIRSLLTDKLGRLPLGFFNHQQTGKLKKIVTDDVERVEQLIAHHFPDFTASIITPMIVFIYLLSVDWRMALVTLLPIPIALFVQWRRAQQSGEEDLKKYHHYLERMNGTVMEYVQAMPIIKAFHLTVQSFARYQQSVEDYTQLWQRLSRKKVPSYVLYMALIESGLIFILPISVWFFQQQMLTLPEVFLFLMMGVGLTAPLKQISTFGHTVQNTIQGMNKMLALLDERELPEVKKEEKSIPQNYTIAFKEVSFSFHKKIVLQDINMTIPEGKVTALVGPSGAGKSTIAQLLARFWDIGKGTLTIGDVPIKQIPQQQLYELVSFVFQDVAILNDTVFANISMGKEDVHKHQLVQAAKAAQAHEFITALPNGYETKIGAGGVHLSGGERQRLAIARALFKDAPILILDEATAYADAENEARIQEGLSRLLQDKTVIVIAHRLSTITDVDQMIVLDDGRVVDKGTHGELLQRCSLYQRLWEAHIEADQWILAGKE